MSESGNEPLDIPDVVHVLGFGEVDRNRLYRASKLRQLLGIGEQAWRKLVRDGLPVYRLGGRTQFVHGADVIVYARRKRVEVPGQTAFPFMQEGDPDAS